MSKQERAKQMYTVKKMSLKAIGNVFHVSHVCVRNWLLAQDVKMRSRGRPSTVNA